MKTLTYKLAGLIFTLLIFAGCSSDGLYETEQISNIKFQVKSGLIQQQEGVNDISFLKVTKNGIKRTDLFKCQKGEVQYNIFGDYNGKNSNRLFVMTLPENSRISDIEPAVSVIYASTKKIVRYKTGSPFGKHQFDNKGRFLVLYHGNSDSKYTDSLFNPNEVAIIDLNAKPSSKNPRILSVNTKGHIIKNVLFPGKITVGKNNRYFVSFIADGMMQLLDLYDKNDHLVKVKLTQDSDKRTVLVNMLKTVKAYKNFGPQIFAISEGATEIFDIELSDDSDQDAGYSTNLSLLDSGEYCNNFTVIKDDGKLLLVSIGKNSSNITIFQIDTTSMFTIKAEHNLSQLFIRNSNKNEEIVIYGNFTNNIYFLTVDNIIDNRGNNLKSLYIPGGIAAVDVLDQNSLIVFNSASSAITPVNLEKKSISIISIDKAYDFKDAVLWKDTFFVSSSTQISYLDLNSNHPDNMVTDEQITKLYIFSSIDMGVAIHGSVTGRATMFPLADPVRKKAFITDGFMVQGILDREEN